MKHHGELFGAQIEQGGRIARDAKFGHVRRDHFAIGPKADGAFAKAQRQPVRRGKTRMVAGGA